MPINKMNISEDEFWAELYKDVPTMLQPGEKTIPMMIDELGREGLDFSTMSKQVKNWVKEGRIEFVGMRISNGKLTKAYRAVV